MTITKLNQQRKNCLYVKNTIVESYFFFYVYNSILNPKKNFNVKKSIVDNIFVMASSSKSWADQVEEEEMEEGVIPAPPILNSVESTLPIHHGIFFSII